MPEPWKATEKRKGAHIDIVLKKDVAYARGTGFDEIDFVHNALPELNYDRIDTSLKLFKRRLSSPIIISGMTGGHARAERINRELAKAAGETGIGMGVGSQRAMAENRELLKTYAVRDAAPDILLIGNVGMAQLFKYDAAKIADMVQKIGADALAVHLNVLQELVQPEGDRNFEGVLKRIEKLCRELPVPVIVKETGAGITRETAVALRMAGVGAIDVSGAGGTSWSAVELYRAPDPYKAGFREWGTPTAVCVAEVAQAVDVPVIASGGIRSGLDIAKGIALGAMAGSAALPFLKAWESGGRRAVAAMIRGWSEQVRMAMMLTGSKNLDELRLAQLLITGRTLQMLNQRNIDTKWLANR